WIHDKNGPLHPQPCGAGAQCVGYFLATKPYTITYRVTARTLNAESSIYTFTYTPISAAYDYYWETWSAYIDGTWSGASIDCKSDKKNNPCAWRMSYSGMWWYTHFSDDPDPTEYNSPSNGRTAGWWNCSIEHRNAQSEITHTATQYAWGNSASTTCDGTKADSPVWNMIAGTCFDASYFRFDPSTDDKGFYPYTWSYYHINSGKWKKNQQPDPYYPAPAGNPGENDNHYFFINFPDDKAGGFKDSDRTTIKNTILSYLDLTPVKRPDAAEYWTKLPIHSLAGKKGLSANADAIGGNAVAVDATKQTPLADSLAWSYTYFDDYIKKYNGGDPSSNEMFGDKYCRGNYIILLTDGFESCRYSGGAPDYNAAVTEAANLYSIHVQTFVIGFGSDIVGNKAILNSIARAGSGGKLDAYFSGNYAELVDALRTIFQAISGQYYGRSNPVVTRQRDRLYRGNFDIVDGAYQGHLMAWNADPKTGALAPEFEWDSGEKMTINGRGNIYTWTGDGLNPPRKDFIVGDSALYLPVYPNPRTEDINGDTLFDDNDSKTIINYTLHPNYNDGTHGAGYYKGKRGTNVDVNGTTYPEWNLGDIYHSTPVVIAEPAFFFNEDNYPAFSSANRNREPIIYFGSNDGMLHGIKNADGNEKFSILPKSLLGKVRDLKVSHDFYVDGSPKAYDVYFKGESKWKTVIVSGLRGGGPYYFAVDVTSPDDPKILWEWPNPVNDSVYQDPITAHLGEAWGKPEIGRVKVGAQTKFVAFITGGISSTDNLGNSFHIIDIEAGKSLKSFIVGDKTNRIPSGPTAYGSDGDGFVNCVYFGDKQGTLWKVDVSSTNTGDWNLYDFWEDEPSKRLPIFYAPAVAKNDGGDTLIFFGTGDETNLTDSSKFYSFYEIIDQGITGKQKWTKNLGPGEKVLGSPTVANWVVYFTTWTSTGGAEYCGAGEGRLYGLLISKLGAPGASEGLVTLDPVTGKWTDPQNYISLGAGIPSAPLVTNGMIYVGTSLNANKVIQVPIPGWAIARTKSWREIIR
ncbi:MAG: pilus assembly protein, partial [Thermodesulfobacteriota bacterium]